MAHRGDEGGRRGGRVHPTVRRSMETLAATAFVDGVLSSEEEALLRRKAESVGMPRGDLDRIIERCRKGQMSFTLPPGQEERLHMLNDIVAIVAADGMVVDTEKALLQRIARVFNLKWSVVERHVDQRLREYGEGKTRQPPPPPPRPEPQPVRREPPRGEEPVHVISDEPVRRETPSIKHPEPQPYPVSVPGRIGKQTLGVAEKIGKDSVLLNVPIGPVQLKGVRTFSKEVPPVTRSLVRSVILFEGVETGVRYLRKRCGVKDESLAREIIRRIMEEDPTIKPKSLTIKQTRVY